MFNPDWVYKPVKTGFNDDIQNKEKMIGILPLTWLFRPE